MPSPRDSMVSLESAESAGTTESETRALADYALKWKTILLLQFQPQFEVITYFGIYFTYICVLMDVTFAYSTQPEKITLIYDAIGLSYIYCFDMVYVLDILLMIFYRSTSWPEMQHMYSVRDRSMITLDIFSVVPFDAIYYSLADANMRIIYLLRLRYLLRTPRFYARLVQLCRVIGANALLLCLLVLFIVFTMYLTTISCVFYYMFCQSQDHLCPYKNNKLFSGLLVTTHLIATAGGIHIYIPESIELRILYLITILGIAFFLSLYIVGYLTADMIQMSIQTQIFKSVKNLSLAKLQRLGLQGHLVYSTLIQYFDLYGKSRVESHLHPTNIKIIPTTAVKSIYLDVSWEAFKHSHIFRTREAPFLQCVASYMNQTLAIPGETIFSRNSLKDFMVYVVSGVVQILSVEDGETPILSFSGGTVFGEINLFVALPSTCSVTCQTTCELQVLSRKSFQEVRKRYPHTYNNIMLDITKRIVSAQECMRLLDYTHAESSKDRELLIIQRLDKTLRELSAVSVTNHRSNIDEKYNEASFETTLFYTAYLDLLVPSESQNVVADTVFIKETCPCVLRPESFVISVWNTVVAVTALVFVYIYPYYASFQPKSPIWFIVFLNAVSVIWMFDLFVSVSTAVKTKEAMIVEIKKIAASRFRTVTFWADLFAACPLNLLTKFLFVNISKQTTILMGALQLMKVYKISYLFSKSEYTYQLTTTYIKYVTLLTLYIYYCAAIFYISICYNSKCNEKSVVYTILKKYNATSALRSLIVLSYLNTEFSASDEIRNKVEATFTTEYIPVLVACFSWVLLYVYFLATAIANTTLQQYDKLRIQAFVHTVADTIDSLKLNRKYSKKIFRFLQNQVDYDGGVELIYSKTEIAEINHSGLYIEAKYAGYVKILRPYPLFYMLSDEFFTDICRCFHVNIYGPGTVITHSGEVCKQIHFICKGYCKVMPFADESIAKTETTGYACGVIEMCFGMPMVNTVVALTHVEMLTTSCEEYGQLLSLHPEIQEERYSIVDEVKISEALLMETILSKLNESTNALEITINENSSFKNFGYGLIPETKRAVDYHTAFDKLQCLSFLRYVLLRVTILPYGRFIHIYEVFVCTFSFFSVLLYPMTRYLTQYDGRQFWQPIYYTLHVLGWIDIAVRHHIAYFNKDGLEITHPLKTITHYWTHGFIIDLLGYLPLSLLFQWLFDIKYIPLHYDIIFAVIHFLRIFRIYNGIRYFEKLQLASSSQLWAVLKYVPLTLVALVFVGTTQVHLSCEFDILSTGGLRKSVHCDNDSWLIQSSYTKPLEPTRVYLYGFLLAANMLVRPTLQGFLIITIDGALKITILSVVAYCAFLYVCANVISKNLLKNADLSIYQEAMADLISFLSYRRIDISVKHEVIAHFEYIWRIRSKKNLKHIITKFNSELQGDILLDVYGRVAKLSDIFENASESFLRSLMVIMDHEIIIKRGIIYRVHDVQNKIFFILNGQVEVVGADRNRLTILPRGSLFGNLADFAMKRQSLTMIANGHVELLTIECSKFHYILSNYHDMKSNYYRKIAINSDYISGAPHSKLLENVSLSTYSSINASKSDEYTEFDAGNIHKVKLYTFIDKWDTFIVPIVSGFGFALELYQIATDEHCFIIVSIAYLLDILGVISMCAKFYTPYENEYGIIICSKRKIALRYIKQPYGFFLHLVSVIPFEIVTLFFVGTGRGWSFWKYFRCNRLLRVILLDQYFYYKNRRLNINVFMIRTFTIVTWIMLTLHVLTCGAIVLCFMNPNDFIMTTFTCTENFETSHDKLLAYLKHFSAICSIFVDVTPTDYYPQSVSLIIYFIILIIVCRMLSVLLTSGMCTSFYIVFHNRMSYAQEIHKLIEFVKKERVSEPLIKNCWNYVSLLWAKKNGHQFPMLLNEAPYYLREAVLNSMFGFHLRRHYLFRFCHSDLIRQIASKFQTRIFLPGDYLAIHKDMDECMYFIQNGQVEALTEDDSSQKVENTFYPGDMFGFEQGIYHRCPHEYSYKAVVYSLVLILNRKDWFYMLDFFPASKEVVYSRRREKQILRKSS